MAGTFEKMSVQPGWGCESAQVYASEQQKTTLLNECGPNVGGGLPPIAVRQSQYL
ncbi:hypothetical protein C4J94_0612 [Pseudomonas sp. R5-89-07]|nr:hypothetical protein C4J94_0612 [Pseudomonas sp. R5-89-07]